MRRNNLKGFSSLGLQIIVFSVIVSIAGFTVVTSTTRSAGEPPGKIVVNEINQITNETNTMVLDAEEYSLEETILDEYVDKEIYKETLDENLKQQNTIDTNEEYNNGQELRENNEVKVRQEVEVNQLNNVSESVSEPIVSYKEETKTEKIGYQTIKENDDNLEEGKEVVHRKGEQGTRSLVYKVEYIDGKEVKRTEISNSVTTDPIDEVVKVGRKKVQASAGKDLPDNYSHSYKSDLEERMLERINEHRIENGLEALVAKNDLKNSGRYKSLSMLQLNYFSHKNPNFTDTSLGYLMRTVFAYSHYSGFGENIGYIKSSNLKADAIDKVFESFKASPGHNANMLRESFKYVGIGVVFSETPGSAFGGPTIFVTQHFAQ